MLKWLHNAFLSPHPLVSSHSPSQISISFHLSWLSFLHLCSPPPYSLHLTLSHSCFALVLSSGCVESRIAAVLHECVCVCVGLREDCCWYEKHADYRSAHKCFTLHQHHESIASGFKSRLQYHSIHLPLSVLLSGLVLVDSRSLECYCRLRNRVVYYCMTGEKPSIVTVEKCFAR